MNTLRTGELYFASFFSNAAILVFEITGGRLLAPYLGTSVEIWAGLIAVVLGSMAIGYRFGGLAADRDASRKTVSLFLFAGGAAALLAWACRDIVPTIFTNTELSLTADAFIVGGILFLPTVAILAALSPLIAKNLITGLNDSARVVGTLNAVGTVGSIAGAVGTGLVLIPLFGVGEIMLGTALFLFLLSVYLARDGAGLKSLVLIAVALPSLYLNALPTRASAALAVKETAYNRILVDDTSYRGQAIRTLSVSPAVQCGMFLKNDGSLDEQRLVFPIFKAFDVVMKNAYPDLPPSRALMLGGCNYSYPRAFLRKFPSVHTDVVEIDPGITQVAEEYFGLKSESFPSLSIINEDARVYANKPHEPYGAVFMDVFGSMSNIPVHVTTKEMLQDLSDNLTDDGFLAINLIDAAEGPTAGFSAPFVNTAKQVFPHVSLYMFSGKPATATQNLVLVASKTRSFAPTLTDAEYEGMVLTQVSPEKSELVLTDDYAPVEYLTTKH